jgi:hypothetical protein
MLRRLSHSFMVSVAAVAVALTFASCSSDSDNPYFGDFSYDMVTYLGAGDNGGSVFSFQSLDDSPLITLNAPATTLNGINAGQRLLLNYVVNDSVSSTLKTVSVNGYAKAITDSLRIASHQRLLTLAMDSIQLKSIWRSGNYINLNCFVKYTGEVRVVSLVVDESTRNNSVVDCYFVHDMKGATTYFWRRCYCSFYIGSLWKSSSCRTLRVHLNDLSYPSIKYYDFNKE